MPLRLPSRPLVYRRALILLVHIALIPLAYLTAFELRFDFRIPPTEFVHFSATVWYLLAIRLLVFQALDRKSTRLNSSHTVISYAVFCLKKKKKNTTTHSKRVIMTHRSI